MLRAPLLAWLAWLACALAGSPECLTGKFTDVQRWAEEDGALSAAIDAAHKLDLSGKPDFLAELRLLMRDESDKAAAAARRDDRSSERIVPVAEDEVRISYPTLFGIRERGDDALKNVFFMSLARNGLERIPLFYTDSNGASGSYWKHLKYLSLYGNEFSGNGSKLSHSPTRYTVALNASGWEEVVPNYYFSYPKGKSSWAKDLSTLDLSGLLELDLRNCSIETLDGGTFEHLTNLRRLYLSRNDVRRVQSDAFVGLGKLVHLDLSENGAEGLALLPGVFAPLTSLKSLDLSYSKVASPAAFVELGASVERLSACYAKLPRLGRAAFGGAPLKHLDISGNPALGTLHRDAFVGLEDTLEVLYAQRLGLRDMAPFEGLRALKVLSLAHNDIGAVGPRSLRELGALKIVDLSDNRIAGWDRDTLRDARDLEFLELNGNSLNLLSEEMLADFDALRFLGLSDNNFVCNCHAKCFIEGALANRADDGLERLPSWYANRTDDGLEFDDPKNETFYISLSELIDFHNAFIYFSRLIDNRKKNSTSAAYSAERSDECRGADRYNFTFQLLDDEGEYTCLDSQSNRVERFSDVEACARRDQGARPPPQPGEASSSTLALALVVAAAVVSCAVLVAWKWWYVRYFFSMMRNAAVLTLLGKDGDADADDAFNYDVFVSYCEHDRAWVLDHLLPNVESDSDLSVCLHERDFQVGMSILENIISCMDRSKTLLMVLSQKFVESRWCQFEMHLAQHRLVETRRERLILVLLEDIPKRKRPNTLNYLMLTKTYIVWPKLSSDAPAFWRRLKRSIVQHGRSAAESTA